MSGWGIDSLERERRPTGPAQRSLSDREEKEEKAREGERERDVHSLVACKKQKNAKVIIKFTFC